MVVPLPPLGNLPPVDAIPRVVEVVPALVVVLASAGPKPTTVPVLPSPVAAVGVVPSLKP